MRQVESSGYPEDGLWNWSETSACIGSIFSHGVDKYELNRREPWLRVSPDYIERRPSIPKEKRYEHLKMTSQPTRGEITGFTRKSRTRLFKQFGRLTEPVQIWQDFTFPDEVLDGMSLKERAEFSSEVLKLHKHRDEKVYLNQFGWWKREWEPRKSGLLEGQKCPHFHEIIGGLPGVTKKNYQRICQDRARRWVETIIYIARKYDSARSKKDWDEIRNKALRVNQDSRSYRWIQSKKMAFVYVSKYVGKVEIQSMDEKESHGRYWGKIGDPPLADPVVVRLNESEDVWLRRVIRRMMKSRARSQDRSMNGFESRIYNSCKTPDAPLFLFISAPGILRILQWVLNATAPPF